MHAQVRDAARLQRCVTSVATTLGDDAKAAWLARLEAPSWGVTRDRRAWGDSPNMYVVCRLCPWLHNDAASNRDNRASTSALDVGQLRTEVLPPCATLHRVRRSVRVASARVARALLLVRAPR